MKSKRKITWGVLLLLLAAVLVFMAITPDFSLEGISIWKMILGVVLIVWIFSKIICGKTPADHLDFFFPLALLIIAFKPQIAEWFGLQPDFVNSWLLIIASVVITIAIHCIFPDKEYKSKEADHNSLGSSSCYVDASSIDSKCCNNKFGEMNVYYQNVDLGDTTSPLTLTINNSFGKMNIHVPKDWVVKKEVVCTAGNVNICFDEPVAGRLLTVTGKNSFGEINIMPL